VATTDTEWMRGPCAGEWWDTAVHGVYHRLLYWTGKDDIWAADCTREVTPRQHVNDHAARDSGAAYVVLVLCTDCFRVNLGGANVWLPLEEKRHG
jgi:hypothetical protein